MKQQKKLSKDMEKFISRMETSQERIKRYLLFNGQETRQKWVPPLNSTEEQTHTPALSRTCRLIELLVTETLPYRINRATKDDPNNEDIVYKKLDRYDRYMLNGTTLSLTYDPDKKTFGCTDLPLMVPFVDPKKPMKKYFNNSTGGAFTINDGSHIKICTPMITVTYPDTTGLIIRVNKDIYLRMQMIYDMVISKGHPFINDDIAVVLGIIESTGFYRSKDLE